LRDKSYLRRFLPLASVDLHSARDLLLGHFPYVLPGPLHGAVDLFLPTAALASAWQVFVSLSQRDTLFNFPLQFTERNFDFDRRLLTEWTVKQVCINPHRRRTNRRRSPKQNPWK
jgi:hypothetical protein